MIEIIVIWQLATRIGNVAYQKGLKRIGYQIMAVILWLCGEIFGAILGNFIFGANASFLVKYLFALIGAVVGAGIAFLVMRFLPNQVAADSNSINSTQEITGIQKFGRSGCVPLLVIIIAVSCVGIGFVGTVLKNMMSVFPQTHATNFMVGTELDNNDQILPSDGEISSNVETIYLSFDYETVEGMEPPVTVDWIVNGQVIHSEMEYMHSGKIVQSIDRQQLGLSEFPKGVYKVDIHIEYALIASVSFEVK